VKGKQSPAIRLEPARRESEQGQQQNERKSDREHQDGDPDQDRRGGLADRAEGAGRLTAWSPALQTTGVAVAEGEGVGVGLGLGVGRIGTTKTTVSVL